MSKSPVPEQTPSLIKRHHGWWVGGIAAVALLLAALPWLAYRALEASGVPVEGGSSGGPPWAVFAGLVGVAALTLALALAWTPDVPAPA